MTAGYDVRTTAHIVQQMKDEGYLAQYAKSKFVMVDSAEQIRIKSHDYCNPMTLIKSYVSLRNGLEYSWKL